MHCTLHMSSDGQNISLMSPIDYCPFLRKISTSEIIMGVHVCSCAFICASTHLLKFQTSWPIFIYAGLTLWNWRRLHHHTSWFSTISNNMLHSHACEVGMNSLTINYYPLIIIWKKIFKKEYVYLGNFFTERKISTPLCKNFL
jgi:hypothetical protein